MALAFQCERCAKRYEVDESFAGKRCKCKQCGHVFPIPAPPPTAPTTPPVRTRFEPLPAAPREDDTNSWERAPLRKVPPRKNNSATAAIAIGAVCGVAFVMVLVLAVVIPLVRSVGGPAPPPPGSDGGSVTAQSGPGPVPSPPAPPPLLDPAASATAAEEKARLMTEQAQRLDEMADALAMVADVPSAEKALPRYKPLADRASAADQRLAAVPVRSLQPGDARRLNQEEGKALTEARTRWEAEWRRVGELAGVKDVFDRAGASYVGPAPAARTAGFGTPEPAPRTRPRPSGATRPGSGLPVTIHVSGAIEDEETRKAIGQEIGELVKSGTQGRGWSVSSSYRNGRLTYTVRPVDDPQEFASQITFGEVKRVSGQQIDVVVPAPLSPEAGEDFPTGRV